MLYPKFVYPILSLFDPEKMHILALKRLARAQEHPGFFRLQEKVFGFESPRLEVKLLGQVFKSPLGLAAGFSKGLAFESLMGFGFAFGEQGTIVPSPQEGNPLPRLHRLYRDRSLINWMGFPDEGVGPAKEASERLGKNRGYVLALNLGANKASVELGRASEDYVRLIVEFCEYADFIVINVSSPNTARLRELQGREALAELLFQVLATLDRLGTTKKVLIKIAPYPDLSWDQIDKVMDVSLAYGVDGFVATNTTLQRPLWLKSRNRNQRGGLSGRGLKLYSLKTVRYLSERLQGKVPIIAVGGIFTWGDLLEYALLGASLGESYTGFVYQGPFMVKDLKRGLDKMLEMEGIASFQEIVGSKDRYLYEKYVLGDK
jgi:dihydroorotate dehydrogenase